VRDTRANGTGTKGSVRRTATDEDRPTVARWPAAPNIGNERVADVRRERHPIATASFAVDHDLAASPVNVIEAESGDLSGPQPETDQQQQDSVVAAADGRATVAATEQLVHLLGLDRSRQ